MGLEAKAQLGKSETSSSERSPVLYPNCKLKINEKENALHKGRTFRQ